MKKIFIGYDHRQAVSYNVLQASIVRQASKPVAIIPLILPQLPITREGLTPFTWSRFLVPHLCEYRGKALFLDADIILNGDIVELFNMADDSAVQVSKSEHRFEWASVMLFNCAHQDNEKLTPEYIQTTNDPLHQISWTDSIGEISPEWNHLVGYDKPKEAKLIHYTQGIPAFNETNTCEYASLWLIELLRMKHTAPWAELMGTSVHALNINGKMVPKFLFDVKTGKPTPGNEAKLKELLTC